MLNLDVHTAVLTLVEKWKQMANREWCRRWAGSSRSKIKTELKRKGTRSRGERKGSAYQENIIKEQNVKAEGDRWRNP